MSAKPFPAVLTVRDFVDTYRVSRTKAYALMAAGELRFFKLGGRRYIRRDVAEAWLDAVTDAFRQQFETIDSTPRASLSI